MDILKEAFLIENEIKEHRRILHKIAEVGFDLPKTIDYVRGQLEKIGCKAESCGKGGITCLIGKDRGECALLRADMDALPIEEKTDLDCKSTNGTMHACGHDMHTAMLLGCAKILKKHENETKMPVRLIFQGAEEQLLGAMDMIENGILDAPRVRAAGMVHVLTGVDFETGTAVLSDSRISSPYADIFEIEIIGKGTHGAMPRKGVDPINVLAHIVIALQGITTREIGLNENASLTIGAVKSGASANVIPEIGILKGSVRSYESNLQNYLKERIVQVCADTARAFRAQTSVRFLGNAPTLINSKELVKRAYKCFESMGASVRCITDAKGTGSEDFAHISQRVPSVMVGICAGRKGDGYAYPLHHPKTMFDEGALVYGTAAYTALGASILQ